MADTGVRYPATVSTVKETGDDNNWVSPANVGADDALYASITAPTFDTPDTSYLLKATNFSTGVPVGAIIDGILVEIERYCDSGERCNDYDVCLTKDGSTRVGDDKSAGAIFNIGTPTIVSFGGAADLWGAAWTRDEVVAATFGVLYKMQATDANADGYVDFIRVTVYYTEPSETEATARLAALADLEAIKSARIAAQANLEASNKTRLAGQSNLEALSKARIAGQSNLEAIISARIAALADLEKIISARLAGRADFQEAATEEMARIAAQASLEAVISARFAGLANPEKLTGARLAGTSSLEQFTSLRFAGQSNLETSNKDRLAGMANLELLSMIRVAGQANLEKLTGSRFAGRATFEHLGGEPSTSQLATLKAG